MLPLWMAITREKKHDPLPKTKAFAGGDPDAPQPTIRNFAMLDEAAAFLREREGGDGCHAVGFFSGRLDAPDHTVFLTVAKRVHPLANGTVYPIHLGRATVGSTVPRRCAAAQEVFTEKGCVLEGTAFSKLCCDTSSPGVTRRTCI